MMVKFACSWICLLLLVAACASDPAPTDQSAQPGPTTDVSETVDPTVDPTNVEATPTPLIVPTTAPSTDATDATGDDDGGDGDDGDDADSDDDATSATSTPVATATPRPTSTPRPIPTAVVVSPTPRPAAPTATAVPPTPTRVPATPTPTATWINPDCYVGPGAADEPVWWCGGQICVVGAPHAGCPTTPPPTSGLVEISCTISKRNIVVGEIITLQAFQNPTGIPIDYAFGHGDGTIDKTSRSRAFYEAPGTYQVILFWQSAQQSGSLLCGNVTVTNGTGPTPTPTVTTTPSPTVQIGCTISPSRTVVVGETLTFTAFQDPGDVPVAYVFDHGDGTLDATSQSFAYYQAPGQYQVRLQWAHSGTSGTVLCGTVTVVAAFSAGDYLGKSRAAAESTAAARGLTSRVVRIDDEWFPITQDYRPDRVNLEIDDGLVTKAYLG